MLGLLTICAIPTTIGVCESVSQQRKLDEEKDEESRMAKFNLIAYGEDDDDGRRSARRESVRRQIDGKYVVLRDGKAWLDEEHDRLRGQPSYTAQCFYIQYPDEEREKTRGLVSRISDDPPALNWLYVDKDTLELKYGNRTQSREHHVGPWDWTDPEEGEPQDENAEGVSGKGGDRLTFEGWEGFIAVEEVPQSGDFALYFDRDDDGMRARVELRSKRKMEVSLERCMCCVEDDRQK